MPEFWTRFVDLLPEVFRKVVNEQWEKMKREGRGEADLTKRETELFIQAFIAHCSSGLIFFKCYIKRMEKKIPKGNMVDIVQRAKSGTEWLLFRLIATDRVWLSDSWIREIIIKKLKITDSKFFVRLGESIKNQNYEVRDVQTRSRSLRYLREIAGSDGSVFNKKCSLPEGADVKNEALKSFIGRRPRTKAKTWVQLNREVYKSTQGGSSLNADALRILYRDNEGLEFRVLSIKRLLKLMKAYHFSLARNPLF